MKTTGRKSRQLIVLALTLTALIGSTISTGFLQPSALADKTVQPRFGPGTENKTTYGPLNDPINLKRDQGIKITPNDARVIEIGRNIGLTGSNTAKPGNSDAEMLLAKLPLSFVENRGQSHDSVRFEVKANNHQIFFTPGEVVFASVHEVAGKHKFDALRMKFDGASSSPTIAGDTLLPGKFNFFEGQDSAKWITDVPSYNGVTYKQLYKGVDLVFRDAQGKLERDFVVAAGVDTKVIRMKYDGAKKMRISKEGELVVDTRSNTLTESKPQAYQTIEGRKVEVEARYKISKDGRVGFEVGDYDRSQPLVIDPILRFSTFINGTAIGLAVDATGVYITGTPNIIGFPATGVFGPGDPFNLSTDTFAAKLSPDGSTLIYADIIRGSSRDFPLAAQVHPSDGTLYLLTETSSPDFPTTVGAFDTSYNGGQDYVVTRINAAGNGFIWSTYIGGAGDEIALGGIDVYNNGDCWFVGSTSSLGPSQGANPFPIATTFGTNLSPTNNGPFDGVAVSLSSALGFVITSGFWGGTDVDEGTAVVINRGTLDFHYAGFTFSIDAPVCLGPGSPFPTCQATGFDTSFNGFRDAHVTRFTNAGRPIGSTLLGDPVNVEEDRAMGVDIDPANNIYVGGITSGPAFPTTPGAFDTTHNGLIDMFVTKFNPTLSGLGYSTFIGGVFLDNTLFGQCIAVNSAGMAHITGSTSSPDFPVTPSVPPSVRKGIFDAFFTKLNPAGSGLILSAYIGGSDGDQGFAIRLNSAGTLATIAGLTTSPDFPTTPGAFDTTFNGFDGFVTQIDTQFSLCIQSPGDPNVLLINLVTGAFKYCTPRGTTITGTGTVTVSGCTTIISGSGANITLNTCSGFGFATVSTPFGFAIISDPNVADNRCVCP